MTAACSAVPARKYRPEVSIEARRPSHRRDAADLAFLSASAENYILATHALGWAPER